MGSLIKYAIIAFIISLIAGALGFSGVSQAASGIAKTLFFVFLVLAVILVLAGTLFVKAVT